MPTPDELWRALYLRTGIAISPGAQDFFRRMGVVERWSNITDNKGAEALLLSTSSALRALKASGLLREESIAEEEWLGPPGRPDERWTLWKDLRSRAGPVTARADWAPLAVTRVVDATAEPALFGERVEVSFDSRLSQGTVVSAIRKLWPRLATSRWVERTRPLGSRSIALIRFVCLESEPDSSWRQMLTEWNRQRPDWKYKGARDFQSAFRRAEKELTGLAYGLEWFYQTQSRPDRWAEPTVREVQEMLRPEASEEDRRFAQRALRRGFRAVEPLVLNYARVVHWAREQASQGWSESEIARRLPDVWSGIDWESAGEDEMLQVVRDLLSADPSTLPDPFLGGFRVESGRNPRKGPGRPAKTKPPRKPRRPVGRRAISTE